MLLRQEYHQYKLYKYVLWLYIILLIMEGGLRKWIFPSLATPLLVIRDPIAIWFLFVAIKNKWLNNGYVRVMMVASTISLFLTLLIGHHDFITALFGWRIYFIHFPMIFIIGIILNRNDLLRICRFFLYVSVPMTILIVVQFYSSPTSWVNVGVGGEGTASFSGAMGYMRPSGTFSFISGYASFQGVVGCVLLYYLMVNSRLNRDDRVSNWILAIFTFCYIVAIPTSISRTIYFQSIIFVFFCIVSAIIKRNVQSKIVYLFFITLITVFILSTNDLFINTTEAWTTRLEIADKVEGGMQGTLGNRYLGGFLKAFYQPTVPVFGYGIGIGTNVGAKLMGGDIYSFGFNGEIEWGRIIGECGLIIGIVIISVRLIFSLVLLKKSYFCLIYQSDFMPWYLSAGMLIGLPQGQWGVPTNLGFCILLGGLTLAAIRTSNQIND